MSAGEHYVDGELHISLEVIAEIYDVQVTWMHEVFAVGLLGRGVKTEAGVCIAAVQFDRVATIVRLNQKLGLDLDSIELHLPED